MRALAIAVVLIAACDPVPPTAPGRHAASATCPGVEPWPTGARTCASDRDCNRAEKCFPGGAPDYGATCGANIPPREDCGNDKDCKGGDVCLDDGPGRCYGRNTACKPRCTATSCAAGERCRTDGHCEPIPCADGYACRTGMHCTGTGDEHGCSTIPCWQPGGTCDPSLRCVKGEGCRTKPCSSASDCACGACVDGVCNPRPGTCGPALPPPMPP